jgi:hypothetical protein
VDVRVKDFRGHGYMWLPSGDVHALVLEPTPEAGTAAPGVTPGADVTLGADAVSPRADAVSPVVESGPSSVNQHAVATGGSTVVQAGRDAHVPTQKADVIQNFDHNDQRGSSFGPVYHRDSDERA